MFRSLLAGAVAVAVAVPAVSFAAVSYSGSSMSSEKTTLKADGIDNTRVTVAVSNGNYAPEVGKTVVLTSSRGSLDEIKIEKDVTNSSGKAYFRVSSLKDGATTISALVDGKPLAKTVTLTFGGGLSVPLGAGDLIKIPDDGDAKTLNDTAVYYYGVNGRRYVFPNEKVYYTWYPDFSKVKVIPLDQMSLIPIGANVTYKPGIRMVKFQTDVKTYLPTKGGKLRWIKTEEVARGLFGSDWANQIDDITEGFYVNYTFGEPIANALDAPLEIIRAGSPSIDVDKGLR